MIEFISTEIEGVYRLKFSARRDDRGSYQRFFCADSLAEYSDARPIQQVNLVETRFAGTLRGLHYQAAPSTEAKFLQILRGTIFDVVVDLRRSSPTFLRSAAFQLRANQDEGIFIPVGCAHGLITLTDDTFFAYAVTDRYQPELERGIAWNDPAFSLEWPIEPINVSKKDKSWQPFTAETADLFE